jgi:hypothetical protein
MYDLTEVLKSLYSVKWIEIVAIGIKNYFEIMFWVEINPNRPIVKTVLGDESDDIRAKMKSAGITFSEIHAVIED